MSLSAIRLSVCRPLACARAGPSRLALVQHNFSRHESSSAALKRAEAARRQAASEPTFLKNDAIPYHIVRVVNPETNKLDPEIKLRELLAKVDLDKNYVQLISAGGPDGAKPIVKIINKQEASRKEREQKSKKKEQKKTSAGRETKEIQLSFTVEPGDLKHKLDKCIKELEKRNRVVVVFVKKKSAPMPSPEQKAARLQAVWEAVQHVATESQPRLVQEATAALYLQGTGKADESETCESLPAATISSTHAAQSAVV
ncbi:translation initiation factor IF3 [Ceratobasidium sp. AG-Ba]|nr:translation initiation factor IF3 [Ceratobasidium sp. AG-Ba]